MRLLTNLGIWITLVCAGAILLVLAIGKAVDAWDKWRDEKRREKKV